MTQNLSADTKETYDEKYPYSDEEDFSDDMYSFYPPCFSGGIHGDMYPPCYSNDLFRQMPQAHERLLSAIQECESMCEHMITFLMEKDDMHVRRRQHQLLHDCADICTFTAKYVARHSVYSKHAAHLCSRICYDCGNECMKYSDRESKECARMCLYCAKECRDFSGM